MENKTERYSDAELEEFRILIQGKIDKAEEDLRILREQFTNNMDNGTEDTSPSFKSFEEGSETMSKEANAQLAARRRSSYATSAPPSSVSKTKPTACAESPETALKKSVSNWFLTPR